MHNEPLREVAAVISNCDVYVTNDTGMMHVSAGVGTPTLSLFGPTDPLQWAPPGDAHHFILGSAQNVNNIPTEKVWHVLLEMLRLAEQRRKETEEEV
jgi:ADP-heptose:LPS heptosyltransferase